MGNMYISFSKMPILFFIYLQKIANIRKYRKNDEYFPLVNSVKCTVFSRFKKLHDTKKTTPEPIIFTY